MTDKGFILHVRNHIWNWVMLNYAGEVGDAGEASDGWRLWSRDRR